MRVTRGLACLFVSALLLVAVPCAHAVDLHDVLTGYSITSWAQKDGLPAGNIQTLARDEEGYLWLGGDAGLVRFDGVRFSRWNGPDAKPLRQAPVRILKRSRDGSLWIGYDGRGGLARIRAGQFADFTRDDGFPGVQVTTFLEDSAGTLWVGTDEGLYTIVADRWKKWDGVGLREGAVYSGVIDRQGTMFLVVEDGIVARRQGQQGFERIESTERLSPPNTLGLSTTRAICEGAAGRLYVTDVEQGFRLVGAGSVRESQDQGRGQQCLRDSTGNLWVATWGEGLWRIRAADPLLPHAVEKVTPVTGLAAEGASSLLEDGDGNIWVGTTNGLNRLIPHKVVQVTNLGVVAAVQATRDGAVWVGTFDGLFEFTPQAGLTPLKHLDGRRVQAMHADRNGTLWVATALGLVGFRKGRATPIHLRGSEELHRIDSITSDSSGALALNDLNRGLLRWDGAAFQPVELPDSLQHSQVAMTFTDSHDRLWISFSEGPIGVRERDGRFQLFGPENGLDLAIHRVLYEDSDGVVWVGAKGGLTRFVDGQFIPVHAVDTLKAVVQDLQKNLWLSTAAGVIRLNHSDIVQAIHQSARVTEYRLYEQSDGVAGMPRWYGDRNVARSIDGRLWFVTGQGITIVDPSQLPNRQTPIPVRIETIATDERRWDRSFGNSLPAGSRNLSIEYAAVNLTSPHKTRFRYRLVGFDADWVEAGDRRQAFYTNLPPGDYRFLVSASDGDSWNNARAADWSFVIRPHFYETRWFLFLSAASLVVVPYAAWKIHGRKMRRQFSHVLAERVRLSRDIHDTVLQSLVGTALECDLVAAQLDSVPRAKERLLRLQAQVERDIGEARQSIWNLRSPDLGRDFVSTLRTTGEQATSGSVPFDVKVTGRASPYPAEVEEELVRISREAVINATRHAHATRIWLEVEYGLSSVTLRVCDDGTGISPDILAGESNTHYGLTTMKERANSVNGLFRIASSPGGGTIVETTVSQ